MLENIALHDIPPLLFTNIKGKTFKALSILGEAYYDKLLNKWWEDYKGQPNVLIDDLGPECIKADHVKRWLDKRKFKAEKKFGSVDIRPEMIIITSNYHPMDVWPRPEDHLPILDRVEVIRLEKLKEWDDTPSKRKASTEIAPQRPKLARQDALDPFVVNDAVKPVRQESLDISRADISNYEVLDDSIELDEL